MADDKRQKLYNIAKSKGVPMPDYNVYNQALDDPQKRQKFYDKMKSGGIPMPEYKTFESAIGTAVKQPETTAGERIYEPFKQTAQTIQKGITQAQAGNIPAGGINIATGMIQAPFAPIGSAIQAVKEIPYAGKPIAGAIEAPFYYGGKALDWAGSQIQAGLDYVGVPKEVQNLGMSPERAKETSEAVGGLNQTIAPILFAPSIAKETKSGAIKAGEALKQRAEIKNIEKFEKGINKAAPPTVKELNRQQVLKRAEKYIAEEERINPIDKKSEESPMRQATERVRNQMDKLWEEKIAKQVERHQEAVVDGSQIAERIRSEITPNMQRFAPEQALKIEEYAQRFEGQIPIAEANAEIARLNAITRNYQKAQPEGKALIEQQHPAVAGYARAVEGLRESVYEKLGDYGEKNVAELRKDYGALKQIHDALERNTVLAEKQTTPTLGKYASPAGTAFGAGAAFFEAVKHPQTFVVSSLAGIARKVFLQESKKNPTIARAFKNLGKTELRPINVESPDAYIRGLLPPPKTEMGTPTGEPLPPIPTTLPDNIRMMPQELPFKYKSRYPEYGKQ